MNKNKIIDFMFDELENNGFIRFNKDSQYHKYLKIEQKNSEVLNDFIKDNIDSKEIRNALVHYTEKYVDSVRDTSYRAKKLFYYKGIKDGIEFITK